MQNHICVWRLTGSRDCPQSFGRLCLARLTWREAILLLIGAAIEHAGAERGVMLSPEASNIG